MYESLEFPEVTMAINVCIDDIIRSGFSASAELPPDFKDHLMISPEFGLYCIAQLKDWDLPADNLRSRILLLVIDECLLNIRYGVDRKDKAALTLASEVEELLNNVYPHFSADFKAIMNEIVFNSKLPIEIKLSHTSLQTSLAKQGPDIMPRLPEMLEMIKRQGTFKTAFELYELLLPQMQVFPLDLQLALIAEMAHSKKSMAHELAILMLLHPKAEIRKQVVGIFETLSDQKVFTSIDLRRLILIRGWISAEERGAVDGFIAQLRKSGLSPAPYPVAKITELAATSMDGAGVLMVLMETKNKNQRQIAGFLVKLGIGIRDTWVKQKVPNGYFDRLVEDYMEEGMPMKPVTRGLVNKLVQHCLFEMQIHGTLPEPSFVEIAEMFAADNWRAEALSWQDEIARLSEHYQMALSETSIEDSLKRSASWYFKKSLTNSWYEVGDLADEIVLQSVEAHKKNPSDNMEAIYMKYFKQICLDKWKSILLITCLWMRSKKEDSETRDMFVVLRCLDEGRPLGSIPLLASIVRTTVGMVAKREMFR